MSKKSSDQCIPDCFVAFKLRLKLIIIVINLCANQIARNNGPDTRYQQDSLKHTFFKSTKHILTCRGDSRTLLVPPESEVWPADGPSSQPETHPSCPHHPNLPIHRHPSNVSGVCQPKQPQRHSQPLGAPGKVLHPSAPATRDLSPSNGQVVPFILRRETSHLTVSKTVFKACRVNMIIFI